MLNIVAKLEVIGKPEPRDWKNNEGQTMKSYRLNVAQNDGVDVETIRCPQDVYDSVRRGDIASFVCTYAVYGDRTDFRIVSIQQIHNLKPGSAPAGGNAK